jgi:hypothetical protein
MRPNPVPVAVAAWLVPGAGHLMARELRKAVTFFVVLVGMFAIGLGFGGEFFPLDIGQPLVFLGGLAEWAIGAPRMLAGVLGGGRGEIVAATYEYGNTFLIVAGLLNALIVLDAVDLARGTPRR